MRRPLLSTALCMALAACGGDDARVVCTLADCLQGLVVTLTTPPTGPYRVEASAPGDATPHAQDCSGSGCLIFFPGFQPSTVNISVIAASGTTTFSKTPTYTTSFPNGRDCGSCVSGAVNVP